MTTTFIIAAIVFVIIMNTVILNFLFAIDITPTKRWGRKGRILEWLMLLPPFAFLYYTVLAFSWAVASFFMFFINTFKAVKRNGKI